jgi:hypothetical protein
MKTRKSVVKIPSIIAKVLYYRNRAVRLFMLFVGIFTSYLWAVHWPDLFHPTVKAFLFQAGMILTAGWWFLTWLGTRTNSLQFTLDYLIFKGITTTRLNARAPYGFSLRELGYRGKGLVQQRRYIDESFIIVLTHASGDLKLGCVYGRNQAETILNALRVQKARLNKNRAFLIDDIFEDNPAGDRPRFNKPGGAL